MTTQYFELICLFRTVYHLTHRYSYGDGRNRHQLYAVDLKLPQSDLKSTSTVQTVGFWSLPSRQTLAEHILLGTRLLPSSSNDRYIHDKCVWVSIENKP